MKNEGKELMMVMVKKKMKMMNLTCNFFLYNGSSTSVALSRSWGVGGLAKFLRRGKRRSKSSRGTGRGL